MRKLILAAVLVFAGSAPTVAADMSGPGPILAAPVFTWDGFYVGAQLGTTAYGSSVQSFTALGGGTTARYSISGLNGGGTIGYNFHLHRNFVLGLEGDLSAANIRGQGATSVTYGCGAICSTQVGWFGSIRGRAGIAFDNVLVYATGGVAFARIQNQLGAPDLIAASTRAGWALGAGVEYAFNQNWSAKVEYMHFNFGTYVWTNAANGGANCIGLGCSTDARFGIIRVGVNYRFGGPVLMRP